MYSGLYSLSEKEGKKKTLQSFRGPIAGPLLFFFFLGEREETGENLVY